MEKNKSKITKVIYLVKFKSHGTDDLHVLDDTPRCGKQVESIALYFIF